MKENLSLVEKVLMKEELELNQKNIEKIEDFLIDVFKIIVHRKQPDENGYYLNYILRLYSESNKVCFNLWWRVPTLYYQSISFLTYEDYKENYLFLSQFEALIKNEKYDSDLKQYPSTILNNVLIYYSGSIYKSLFVCEDRSLMKDKKDKIMLDLCEDVFRINFFSKSKNMIETEYEGLLLELDLSFLFKCFIDNGEVGKVWNKLFLEYQPLNNNQTIDLSIICVVNYLYYLAKYEPLAKNTLAQINSVEILKKYNDTLISHFYDCKLADIIDNYKELIFKLMRQWEWFPEESAKTVISDYSTIDFFIFLALNTCWNNEDISRIVNILGNGSMFSLYNRYFGDDSSFDVNYSKFQQIFLENQSDTTEVREKLLGIIGDNYKQEILDKGIEREIKYDEIEDYRKSLLRCCHEAKNSLKGFFHEQEIDDKDNNTETVLILRYNTISPLSENFLNSTISNIIKRNLLWAYLSVLEKRLLHETISKKKKCSQKTMIDLIKIRQINPTVMIGTKDVFWEEKPRTLLKEYLEKKV